MKRSIKTAAPQADRVGSHVTIAHDGGDAIAVRADDWSRALRGTSWERLIKRQTAPSAALARAVRRSRQGIASDDPAQWVLIRRDDDRAMYGLLRVRVRGGERSVSTTHTAVVTAWRDTGAIEIDRFESTTDYEEEILRRVSEHYDVERGALTAQDIRDMIDYAMRDVASCRIGRTTSHYVPVDGDTRIDELAPALALAHVRIVSTPILESAAPAFAADALSAVVDAAAALREKADTKAEAYETATTDVERARAGRSATTILSHCADLLDRARLYRSLLRISIDDVESAIESVQNTMTKIAQ